MCCTKSSLVAAKSGQKFACLKAKSSFIWGFSMVKLPPLLNFQPFPYHLLIIKRLNVFNVFKSTMKTETSMK